MREPDLQVLRVRGRQLIATTARGTNHQRDRALPAEHGIDFRGMIDNLIHRQDDEIDGHDLHDGTQPEHGGTGSHPDKPIFDNGRVHHPFGAKFIQEPGRDFIGALEDSDLLPKEEDIFIAQQFFAQRVMQRLPIGDLSDAYAPFTAASPGA